MTSPAQPWLVAGPEASLRPSRPQPGHSPRGGQVLGVLLGTTDCPSSFGGGHGGGGRGHAGHTLEVLARRQSPGLSKGPQLGHTYYDVCLCVRNQQVVPATPGAALLTQAEDKQELVERKSSLAVRKKELTSSTGDAAGAKTWRWTTNCRTFSGIVLRHNFDSVLPSEWKLPEGRVQQGWSSPEGQLGR